MMSNVNSNDHSAFHSFKKTLLPDPAFLMLTLTEQDTRLYFIYCVTHNKFYYTNAAFRSFFGPVADHIPETFLDFVDPDEMEYLQQCFSELRPGIAKNDIELNLNLPHKKACRLKLNLVYNHQPDGNHLLVGYAEEIACVWRAANPEEFHHKKAMLNTVSHDLLSPMGSIHNLAALLARKDVLKKDPEVSKWVLLIEMISKRSISTIRTFIRKEFVDSGKYVIAKND
ncbi:MAG: hypothetical protein EOP42_09065 [Sphingobacteriaceae bacterium]|nr:MAG: hypothetical protein EOP42_09065 [Sphingobacteriaceae bacterium]